MKHHPNRAGSIGMALTRCILALILALSIYAEGGVQARALAQDACAADYEQLLSDLRESAAPQPGGEAMQSGSASALRERMASASAIKASEEADRTLPFVFFTNGGARFVTDSTLSAKFTLNLGSYSTCQYTFFLVQGSYTFDTVAGGNVINQTSKILFNRTEVTLSWDSSNLAVGTYTAVVFAQTYSSSGWEVADYALTHYYITSSTTLTGPTVHFTNGDAQFPCGGDVTFNFNYALGDYSSSKYSLYLIAGLQDPDEALSPIDLLEGTFYTGGAKSVLWSSAGCRPGAYTAVIFASALEGGSWTARARDHCYFTLTEQCPVRIDSGLEMRVGQRRNLQDEIRLDSGYAMSSCYLVNNSPDLVAVSGLTVYALAAGTANLTVKLGSGFGADFSVSIASGPSQLSLPSSVTEVKDEAFAGVRAVSVLLPSGCKSIGSRAFANNPGLQMVYIPESVDSIADDAFAENANVWLLVKADSAAQRYAQQLGLDWVSANLNTPAPSTSPGTAPTPGTPTPTPSPTPSDVNEVSYRAYTVGQVYSGSLQLNGTVRDMQSIGSMLGGMSATKYSVKAATNLSASGILAGINSALGGADSNDVSLFYYSGHGAQDGSLVGSDENCISPALLRSALDRIPGKKIVLVDACHSGTIIGKGGQSELLDFTKAFTSGFISAFHSTEKSNDNLASNDYYVITACAGSETSVELKRNGVYFGLFTYAFTHGCGWDEQSGSRIASFYADSNRDGMLTLSEVFNYTTGFIVDYAEAQGLSSVQSSRCHPVGSAQVLFAR